MNGFAVYSATVDPDRLYSAGQTSAIDAETTREIIWAGDQPLELVVDFSDRRIWWPFEADRETKARRTGQFIAAYHGNLDLFRGFSEQLRELHDTNGWALPYGDSADQNIGFKLWRVSPSAEDDDQIDRFIDGLLSKQSDADPVRVGMKTHQSAYKLIKALEPMNVQCTVAVDSAAAGAVSTEIDLLLVPGADQDFDTQVAQQPEPVSERSTTVDSASNPQSGGEITAQGITVRIAAIVLVGLVGFATYSFVSRQPVLPISGLGMFGGLLGTLGAFTYRYATTGAARPPRDWLQARAQRFLPVLMLGGLAGFAFPKILWNVGLLLGRDGYLFGPLFTLSGSLPATVVYAGALFGCIVGVFRLGSFTGRLQPLTQQRLVSLSVGVGIYALCLFLATGLAESVWFQFIPAAR